MSADQASRRCGVLGSPIAHSLSPVLHRAAYAALGLDWRYDATDVKTDQLAAYVAELDSSWRGLSLTMPLKRAAIDLCAHVEPMAAQLEAVNTMVRESDGTWSGSNTDMAGCVRALEAADVEDVRSVVLVGAGATAAAALAAVVELGARDVTVLARSRARAETLVALGRRLGVVVAVRELMADVDGLELDPVDLVVSTIPATAQSAVATTLAAAADTVFDVIYDPATTPLLAAARAQQRPCIAGFELLLHQAALQVEQMTGTDRAPIAEMRLAGLSALKS